MARFYQTDKPKFVEDFIYQPPWEMMDRALQVNQEGLQNAADRAALFGNIPVDFIGESPEARAKAEELINYYTQQGTNISDAINKDPMNWRRQAANISNVRNQLSKDYQVGDLSKLKKSRENYDETMKHLNSIDPTIRQAAKDKLMKDYNAGVAEGKIFEQAKYLDRVNLNEKFAQSLINTLGGSSNANTKDLVGKMKVATEAGDIGAVSGYIREYMTSSASNKAEIEAALQAFVKEPGNRAYMDQMQGLGLETYTNDKGELLAWDDPRNSLSGLKDRATSLVKTATVVSDKLQYDQKYGVDAQIAEARRKDNADRTERMLLAMGATPERGESLKDGILIGENQMKLSEEVNKILDDPSLSKIFKAYPQTYKNIKNMTLDKKTVETINLMKKISEQYPAYKDVLGKEIGKLTQSVTKIERDIYASWANDPDYNDPLKMMVKRVGLTNAFRNGSQTELTFALGNNDSGYRGKPRDLNNMSLQMGKGIPGTEIYRRGADGKNIKDANGIDIIAGYSNYYPRLGAVGYNPSTGQPEITNSVNQKYLVAATFTPSTTEEPIPVNDSYVTSADTKMKVPTAGTGRLYVNIIGYTPDEKGNYKMQGNPTTTICTTFETQGAGSINSGGISSSTSKNKTYTVK